MTIPSKMSASSSARTCSTVPTSAPSALITGVPASRLRYEMGSSAATWRSITLAWARRARPGIRGCEDDRMPRHASRSIVISSGVLLVVLAAHDLSHALDGGLETPVGELALVAVPQWLVLAAVMTVIVRGDRAHGAAAALLLGIGVTAWLAVVPLLPVSTASYWDLQPS